MKELSLREFFLYQCSFEFTSQGIFSEVDALFLQELLHADVVSLEDGGLGLFLYPFNIINGFLRDDQMAWDGHGDGVEADRVRNSAHSRLVLAQVGKVAVTDQAWRLRAAVFFVGQVE